MLVGHDRIEKHLYHGSSSLSLYRRRYNVVGDLMRPSETAASSSVDGHIVSHAVNMAINSF